MQNQKTFPQTLKPEEWANFQKWMQENGYLVPQFMMSQPTLTSPVPLTSTISKNVIQVEQPVPNKPIITTKEIKNRKKISTLKETPPTTPRMNRKKKISPIEPEEELSPNKQRRKIEKEGISKYKEEDLKKLKVNQLQKICQNEGLVITKKKKSELIEMLLSGGPTEIIKSDIPINFLSIPGGNEILKIISSYLTINEVSKLSRTCKSYFDFFMNGTPDLHPDLIWKDLITYEFPTENLSLPKDTCWRDYGKNLIGYYCGRFDCRIVGMDHYYYPGKFDGADMRLKREKKNSYDNNAIAVHGKEDKKIGFIERENAAKLSPLIDSKKISSMDIIVNEQKYKIAKISIDIRAQTLENYKAVKRALNI